MCVSICGLADDRVAPRFQRTLNVLPPHRSVWQWLVTYRCGDDWVVLDAHGSQPIFRRHDVMSWSETICALACSGDAPWWIPNCAADHRTQSIGMVARHGVRAYVGAPLVSFDGHIFGTLCGIDREPSELRAVPLNVTVVARFLSELVDKGLSVTHRVGRIPAASCATCGEHLGSMATSTISIQ